MKSVFKHRSTPLLGLLWVLSLWLLHDEVVSRSFLEEEAYVDVNDGALIMRNDYLSYYLGGQKMGYSHFILKEDSDESLTKLPGKYFVFQAETKLLVKAMGISFDISIRHFGEVNEDLSLRSIRYDFESSGQKIYIKGDVEHDTLQLTTVSEGNESEQSFPLKEPLYHPEMVHLLIAREGMEEGKSETYSVFDPMTMSFGTITAKVEGNEVIEINDGEEVKAYKINVSYKGLNSTSWISQKGELYKDTTQISGMEFVAIKEPKEKALDLHSASEDLNGSQAEMGIPDLIESSRIITDVKLPNPAQVTELVVEVEGAEKADLMLDGEIQKLESEDEGKIVLSVHKMDYGPLQFLSSTNPPPYKVEDPFLEEYLSDSPLIQSSHPKIQKKALEITGNAENPWEAAEQIAEWLYRSIKKEMRPTMPSALEVLNSMRGDCNEHSTLLAAISRSIGIPTKICAGLVYQDDGFYYHAWNEVYVNGEWYPIDSTLNRIQMDAAHIKLAEGSLDSQANIMRLIGNLDLRILSFKE